MSDETTGKTVYYTLDPLNPPAFTAEEQEEYERLLAMKDEDIDFSDIPRQTEISRWHRPGKAPLSLAEVREKAVQAGIVLLDDDVRTLFLGDHESVNRKINAVLREYGEAERKRA